MAQGREMWTGVQRAIGREPSCDPSLVASLINIHFVCTGNIYRSRLAEAYAVSRGIPGIRVTSSGIAAGRDGQAAISPWAADVLSRYGLERHAAPRWQRTTAELLQSSDIVVFMESEHQRFCAPCVEVGRHRVEVWEIEDIGPMEFSKIPQKVEQTFAEIRKRTDELIQSLALNPQQ
jgi:protein-tyrosine-phosphatase